jgi:spermidine synthase
VAAQATVVQYDYDVEAMMWASFALKHWNKDVYNDSRLKVVIADANKVELEPLSADAVIIDLFDYRPEEEAFMTRVICKAASALRPGGRLSAYLGDDTAELRLFIDRLQLGDKFIVHKSLALIPSYGGANSVFLVVERLVN